MAAASKRAARDEPVDETALRDALDALYLEGSEMVAQPKLLGVVEQWTSRTGPIEDEVAAATAIMLAMDLELFAPRSAARRPSTGSPAGLVSTATNQPRWRS